MPQRAGMSLERLALDEPRGNDAVIASRRLVFTELDCQSARPREWTEPGETMKITRSTVETTPGPADWFTGSVFIDRLAVPSNLSAFGAASVHFTPGAHTAWHTHPYGQTIWIAEGVGLCQREGGPIEVIRPGDCVFFEPGENHWHGATPTRFMTHIAMQLADETGSTVSWGRHVSEDEYNHAPGLEEGNT